MINPWHDLDTIWLIGRKCHRKSGSIFALHSITLIRCFVVMLNGISLGQPFDILSFWSVDIRLQITWPWYHIHWCSSDENARKRHLITKKFREQFYHTDMKLCCGNVEQHHFHTSYPNFLSTIKSSTKLFLNNILYLVSWTIFLVMYCTPFTEN